MSKREILKKVEKLFLDASRRYGETLPIPDLSGATLTEAQAYELFKPQLARIAAFLRGYQARFERDPRNASESVDWLDGWDACKADLAKLTAISAAERFSVEEMVTNFKLRDLARAGH